MKKKLTKAEQRLVNLVVEQKVKEQGRFSDEELERLSLEIEVDKEVIQSYINMQPSKVEPQKVDKIPVSPMAESIRSNLSLREGMTIMSEATSVMIQENKPNYKTSTRYDNVVYRGNTPTKRNKQ